MNKVLFIVSVLVLNWGLIYITLRYMLPRFLGTQLIYLLLRNNRFKHGFYIRKKITFSKSFFIIDNKN